MKDIPAHLPARPSPAVSWAGAPEPFQPREPPRLSCRPPGWPHGRGFWGAAEHASSTATVEPGQQPWGLLLLPARFLRGWLWPPPRSSPPGSSMSPVQARGCLVGPPCQAGQGTCPPRIRLGLRLHPSPTTTLARTRHGWEVGAPGVPAWGWLQRARAPGWPQAGAGAWPGCAVGWPRCWSLGPGAPPLPPARRLLGPQGKRAPPCPLLRRDQVVTPMWWALAPAEGAAQGQASAPSVSSAGGAAAAGLSEQPWGPCSGCGPPPQSLPVAARGLCRWGGGRRIAGARARGLLPRSGWSSAPCPARLPAMGHGAQSRLERRSQPGRARLRQRLQAGQPEGS